MLLLYINYYIMQITHFAGQEFFELFDGFGDGERVEKRVSTGHGAHGHVAHSHSTCTV